MINNKTQVESDTDTNTKQPQSIFAKNTKTKKKNEKNEKTESTRNKKKNEIDSLSDSDYEDNENENGEAQMILSLKDIESNIPPDAVKNPIVQLQRTHTEWRWRFFDLKGRKLIEISKKSPNKERIYMDNTGKWVSFVLKGNWDQFLVDTRYYYMDK